ncbi:MAG: ribonuclease P protein component [Hyphomicrobiaceae bacterium]
MSRTAETQTFHTLKKRAEFQRVRGGGRATAAAFVLEGKPRPEVGLTLPTTSDSGTTESEFVKSGSRKPTVKVFDGPRFGFTITKKIGNAVVRNRIRRRLRAALVELSPLAARSDTDYVLVARLPATSQSFATLVADLKAAFERVHSQSPKSLNSKNPGPKSSKSPSARQKGVTEELSRPSPRSATSTQQSKSSRD